MANITVTYDEIRSTAHRLAQGKEDLHGILVELSALVTTLTQNGFQAEQSSAAYRDSYEQFTSGTKSAVDGLDGLGQFLIAAADTLQQTDESLASALRG